MAVKMTRGLLSSMFPLTIPLLGIFGAITLYKNSKVNKKVQKRLQYFNQYENQGYVISDSTQIMNRYNSIPANQAITYTRDKELVRPFMEQFERSLGNDVRLARHNYSTLKLKYSKELLKTGAVGTYDGTKNIIKYVKNNATILGHEMLHMASYMYDPSTNTHYHGFMQQRGDAIIGTGLNEGYTELMNSRLFTNGKITSYKRLVRIVKLLEDFFPNPQIVSHYYFTCNFPAFAQNLSRYCTQEELKDILFGMDKLYEYECTRSNPTAIILETQIASKLYTIYERNFATDPAKVEAFKQKANENKLTGMVISGKRMAATRTNPFTKIKNGITNGFRKIKNFFTRNQQPTPQPAYVR